MSNISFLGACNEVTGSKIIISNNDTNVMLDCGMHQGLKDVAYLKNKHFNENTPNIDYCILSHAHIDHSGNLPTLIKNGYKGRIYSTPPTRDLCKHMLKDSVAVFTKELPVISKILKKNKSKEQVYPLYSVDDVEQTISRFVQIRYDEVFKLNKQISCSFHDSCHILGSASVKIDVKDHDVSHRIWYTSDIGHDSALLTNEPSVPQNIDYLVIESTYGNKKREEQDVVQKIMNTIIDTCKRGNGKVIIPAFSVGRMQTILLIVHKLHILGLIPNIPIYIDSPLGVKVTRLYEKYEDEINQEIIKFFRDNGYSPFEGQMINYVSSQDETNTISTIDENCIIISASGMAEGGPIRTYLKNNVEDKHSTVLFVGYNGEGTLGRRLQDNNGRVTIDGENIRVRCKVESISGLSAHADKQYLLNYIEQCVSQNAIKTIFLIHGDKDAIINMKNELHNIGISNVVIPILGEKYKL